MIAIPLSEQTAERLRALAQQSDTDISELLEKAVVQFLAADEFGKSRAASTAVDAQQRVIDREQQFYNARHAALRERYAGETIAMIDGNVVDHDTDRVALSRRIRHRYGNQPIFITPVLPEPIQQIEMRSPQIAHEPYHT